MKLCSNKTCELNVACNLYSEMAIPPYSVNYETFISRDDFGDEKVMCKYFKAKKFFKLGSKLNNEKAAAMRLEIVEKFGGDQKEILMRKLNVLCQICNK